MSNTVKAGYMGWAEVGDYKVRCTDFNVKLRQDVLFYDHIIGLRDSIPTSIFGGKGEADPPAFNKQKIFYRPSVKIVEGNINFPLAEWSAKAFFEPAYKGDSTDITLIYACGVKRKFTDCKINTYNFSATSGELANISISVMGKSIDPDSGTSEEIYDTPEKLITFDNVKIIGTGGDDGIVSFDFSINNNCIPIYTAGTNMATDKLLANDIRVGMQQVTGSITFYNDIGPIDTFIETITAPQTVTVTAGDFSAELTILYQYPERQGQVSAYVRTIPFVCVDYAVKIP